MAKKPLISEIEKLQSKYNVAASLSSTISDQIIQAESLIGTLETAYYDASDFKTKAIEAQKKLKADVAAKKSTSAKNIPKNMAKWKKQLQSAETDVINAEVRKATAKRDLTATKKKVDVLTRQKQTNDTKIISIESNIKNAIKIQTEAFAAEKNKIASESKIVPELETRVSNLFKTMERSTSSPNKELQSHVLGTSSKEGTDSKPGTRADKNKLIADKPYLFDKSTVEGRTAHELLNEAVSLSELSLTASQKDANSILGRLLYLEKTAKAAGGDDDDVAKLILSIIGPVKTAMAKKATFSSFTEKRIGDYVSSIPEMLIRKIPGIGGVLGDYMKQQKDRRDAELDEEKLMARRISEGKSRGRYSDDARNSKSKKAVSDYSNDTSSATPIKPVSDYSNDTSSATPIKPVSDDTSSPMADIGGSRASELDASNISSAMCLDEILKEVIDIRKLLHESLDPEESSLTGREKQFETPNMKKAKALKPDAMKEGGMASAGGSWLDSLLSGGMAGLVVSLIPMIMAFLPVAVAAMMGAAGFLGLLALAIGEALLVVTVAAGMYKLGEYLSKEYLIPFLEKHGLIPTPGNIPGIVPGSAEEQYINDPNKSVEEKLAAGRAEQKISMQEGTLSTKEMMKNSDFLLNVDPNALKAALMVSGAMDSLLGREALSDEEMDALIKKKGYMKDKKLGELLKPKEGTQKDKAMEFERSHSPMLDQIYGSVSTSESPRNNINSVQNNNYVTNINSKSGTRNTESTLEKMNRSSFA